MKFAKNRIATCLLVVLVLLAGSCRKNQSSGWNTELLVPIVSTTLSLQNLVTDTSSIKTNKDSSLTLAYSSQLYQFNLANIIVQIPDTSVGQKFNIDSLQLPSIHLNFVTTLGGIANQLGGFIQQYIDANIGQTTTTPTIAVPTAFSYSFDASGYFDSAQLTSGEAYVIAVNHLPDTIAAGTTCIVSDSITHDTLQVTSFPAIPPGDSIYLTIPFNPTRITSHLLFTIGHLVIDGSGPTPVLIDTSDSIILRVYVTGLHVSEAWAKFPTQSVVDQTGDVTFNLGARKFSYIDARAGHLHIKISNSVPQPLYLQYTLVGAFNKLGKPLTEFTTVPQAVGAVPGVVDTSLDITGYSINLTGKSGSSFNTYTQRVLTRLDSTGVTQHITVQDSLNIKYTLEGIEPNYIKGYMATDTVHAADSAAFNFLSIFKSGSISLNNVNMNFSVVNGIGVDGIIKINSLTAFSPNNGMQTLVAPSILGQPLYIKRATDFPLTPAVSNFSLNSNNSTIGALLGILPNQLKYDIQVQTNPHGNSNQYRDFAYLQSGLSVNLNAEIPLSLIANGLVLKDTIPFNLANTTTNVNGISDGIINVIAENKYPIQGILTIIIYDINYHPLDTFALNKTIAAGNLDANCKVDQPTQTVIQEYVDNNRINKLKQGAYAVITSDFSTVSNTPACNGQHLKIYSNYTIGITLSAKFNYKVTTKL
jgi:hypothetical protein